jgi:hypothetical protein
VVVCKETLVGDGLVSTLAFTLVRGVTQYWTGEERVQDGAPRWKPQPKDQEVVT